MTRPERRLVEATVVNTVGSGLLFTISAIFLTRHAGFSPGQVGLGLTLGGLAGLAGGVRLGARADRHGAREVLVGALVIEAAGTALLMVASGVGTLALAAALAAIGRQGSSSGRGALIGRLVHGPERSTLQARLRAVSNIGLIGGSGLAAVVLAVDTRTAFLVALGADVATFLVAAAIVLRIAHQPPTAAGPRAERSWPALRDRPFLAFTALSMVTCLQYHVLTIALPLWVTLHTAAPRWMPSVLFLLAAVTVAALQVRVAAGVSTPAGAARAIARSGPVFLVGWSLVAAAGAASAAVAVVLLLAAIALHVLGELWQASGAFELSFALPPARDLGQYQGVYGVGLGIGEALAPIVLIALCVTWGAPGWIVLGVLVTAASALTVAVQRWASATGAGARSAVAEPA